MDPATERESSSGFFGTMTFIFRASGLQGDQILVHFLLLLNKNYSVAGGEVVGGLIGCRRTSILYSSTLRCSM